MIIGRQVSHISMEQVEMSLLQESIHILKCCRKSQGLRDDITVLRSLPAIFQKPGKPLSIIEPVPQVQMPVLAFFFFFFNKVWGQCCAN